MAHMRRPQRDTLFNHRQPRGSLNPNTRHQIDSGIPQIYTPHDNQHLNHSNFEHILPINSSSPVALPPINGHQRLLNNQKLHHYENMGVLRGQTDLGLFVLPVFAILVFIVSTGSYIIFRRYHNNIDRANKCRIGEERGEDGEDWFEMKDF